MKNHLAQVDEWLWFLMVANQWPNNQLDPTVLIFGKQPIDSIELQGLSMVASQWPHNTIGTLLSFRSITISFKTHLVQSRRREGLPSLQGTNPGDVSGTSPLGLATEGEWF